MTFRTISHVVTILSLSTALGLQVACVTDQGSGGRTDDGGRTDPCTSGHCMPSGFPFVKGSRAISDACFDQGCPLLAADTPVGKTTATLSQPQVGTLCLAGMVSPGGWATLGVLLSVKSQDQTEILKKFDANSLGITQLEFTIDSPPSGGVGVHAGISLTTSCSGDKFACLSAPFTLMTGPGSSVPLRITLSGRVRTPFANFMQTDGGQSFDTSSLDNWGFDVGPGNYDFCVHDFKFLDAQGNEVKDTQQADSYCGANAWSAGDTAFNLTVGGLDRQYILHVPAQYTGSERVPLVVDLHGFGADGARQKNREGGWKEKADREGFIVVFPTGSPIPARVGSSGAEWSAGDGSIPAPSSVDDVAFIRTVVTKITSDGCIDPKRVYATGVSNGGAMVHWLGCEAADLFAAVAPVAADIMGHPCNPSRPIPIVFFRATDDTVATYAGGEVLPGVVGPGALSSFQEWRTHDGCTGDSVPANGYCSSYIDCDGESEVVLCSLAPDPGSAPIDHAGAYAYPFTNGFKLVDFAWAFLSRFRLHTGS